MPGRIIYQAVAGSHAFGTAGDRADIDVYMIVVPPTKLLYPGLDGIIYGFDKMPNIHWRWKVKQEQQYDIKVVSIAEHLRHTMSGGWAAAYAIWSKISIISTTRYPELKALLRSKKVFEAARRELVDETRNFKKSQRRMRAYFAAQRASILKQLLTGDTVDLAKDAELLRAIRGSMPRQEIGKYLDNALAEIDALPIPKQENPDPDKVRILLLNCIADHTPAS